MKPKSFMVIAGEPSGDALAAELVRALRLQTNLPHPIFTADTQPLHTQLEPRFFGAGGAHLAAEGVELLCDLTAHSVVGLTEVLKKYFEFRAIFQRLYRAALERQPDAIICVDFSGFNRRFAHAIRRHTGAPSDWFQNWKPRIIQYVSPQVWASRESRAYQMAQDYDLLLSIFPFEKDWYAQRVPDFPVTFVGHPIFDRYGPHSVKQPPAAGSIDVLLLPGSRPAELARHLPVMFGALDRLRRESPTLSARMVLPDDRLTTQARELEIPARLEIQCGGLREALQQCRIAIASTGTVTVECAYFGVPTVAIYKTSWGTYQIGKRLVRVKYLAMPNLLADAPLYPEFIQDAATPEAIAREAADLLRDDARRAQIKSNVAKVVASLGEPGAGRRAAAAILQSLQR
jgi:lipid-A-disaccharide synthase